MKYYLIAGEASGDLHASNLMHELKKCDNNAEFRFFGGDLMKAQGGTLVKHYKEMAFMGFVPVLLNARTILNNMKKCKEDIALFSPDVVILIDYPGFNLKIAEFVKTHLGIPVHYYISPKIWAWKQYRIKSFRRYVDKMYCILPFETEFFDKLNYKVDYVGNPSVDSVYSFKNAYNKTKEEFDRENELSGKPILAILAGSRRQEIKDNLPMMLRIASRYEEYQLVVAGAPGIEAEYYNEYIGGRNVTVLFGKTYEILQHSYSALVTSGTATLETALFRVPQVVCYYTPLGKISSFVFRHFFHIPYISLVNLVSQRKVVKELFGEDFTENKIRAELELLLFDDNYRCRMLSDYDRMISILGNQGASERTAKLIFNEIFNK